MCEIVEFLGNPVDYWIALKALVDTKGIDNYIERLAQLEAELEKAKEKKIRCPHCARFCFLTPEGRKLVESLEVNKDFVEALEVGLSVASNDESNDEIGSE